MYLLDDEGGKLWTEEALSVAKFEGWLSPGGSVERSQFVGWLSMRTDTRGWPRQCRGVVEAEDGLEVSTMLMS